MHRSKFKNIYNKKSTDVNWANYKERNFFVTLLWRTKKDYFQNTNVKDLSKKIEKFWETVKPCFSNKESNSNKNIRENSFQTKSNQPLLPLFMRGKLGNSNIDCGDNIQKKPCLFTFSSAKQTITANDCTLFRYTMIISVQKLTQVIKSVTSGFQIIKRHNRKILKGILKTTLK